MTTPQQPSWQRLVWWLIAGVIGLQIAAYALPKLVVSVVVLAAAFCVVRLVLFHTRDRW